MKKPKVLLIQDVLVNYRDPIYSLINEQVDLTVGYTTLANFTVSSYPIIQLPYYRIGKLIWHKNLKRIINQYDVVVYAPYFKMIRLALLPFVPHKPKLVTWSLGVHASYTRPYDLTKNPDFEDKIYETIQDHADACVFYMPEPIEYWKKYRKIDDKKYFVAHNTVAVAQFDTVMPEVRDTILFVGTLYKEKGVGELIDCYFKAKKIAGNLPLMKIVGKGAEKDNIEQHIKDLGLADDVEMTGAIYDENILKNYFAKAIVCVSPKQAGLTVLKSLGYGVPFVTRLDAITGGEKKNIINGKTGLFYGSEDELVNILVETATKPEIFASMSDDARNYYLGKASPERMAQGVVNAIKYVTNCRFE